MQISEVTRRHILDHLLLIRKEPFYGRLEVLDFLKRVWNLESMPSEDSRFSTAEADIWQHMVRNSDWDDSYLLYERLDLLHCSDDEFKAFVATCVHPVVMTVPGKAADLAEVLNQFLQRDGFRLEVTREESQQPVYEMLSLRPPASEADEDTFEVVLSFAGEDRDYVESVAAFLLGKDVRVFYDRFEEVTLWGKDLAAHLDKVYRSKARYCIMFISKHYATKLWPSHERRSAFARALEEKHEYILPARFDQTEIPGLQPTIGYVDLSRKTPEELGTMIIAKLGRRASVGI